MANSILSMFVGQKSFKLYSNDGISVLNGVKIIKVNVILSARLFKNTGEDGIPIIDAKMILPVRVIVTAIAESVDSLQKINKIFSESKTRYTIYSRGIFLKGLVVASESFRQNGKVISATPVDITFNGILIQDNDKQITSSSSDSDTIIGGIVNTISIEVTQQNISDLIVGD